MGSGIGSSIHHGRHSAGTVRVIPDPLRTVPKHDIELARLREKLASIRLPVLTVAGIQARLKEELDGPEA